MRQLVLLTALLAASPASYSALLAGDVLAVRHEKDGVTLRAWSVTVPDSGFGRPNGYLADYTFEMFGSGFQLIGRNNGTYFGATTFEGLVFEGFDPSLEITGISLGGSWAGRFDAARIQYTAASLSLDLKNLPRNNYDILEVRILTAPATSPVPLPAAAWLLLSGLGGLGAFKRRRRTTPRALAVQ